MTNAQNLRAKTYRPEAKSASILLLVSLSCFGAFRLVAMAQERTYSANSLMAAFEKGSKLSIKGTEITVRDVIVENENSKVIFKSSGNDKVICELDRSTDNRNVQLSVGSPLTVTGKVRGRGLLGNVTLDECKPVRIETTKASPNVHAQESPAAAPPRESSQDPIEKLVVTKNVPATTAVNRAVRDKRLSAKGPQQPNKATRLVSNSVEPSDPYLFYALVVELVALALLVLAKLFGPDFRAMGFGKPLDYPNTPETRQAALEALLLGHKNRK